MKKIVISIILLIGIFSFKSNYVDAYVQREFNIEWVCINIDIPLNSNFNDYKDNYIVNVYVDGKKLDQNEYYVMLNQNGTSTSTINTSKVGTHKIGARVELYDYNASSDNFITYKIIDNEAPEITITKDTITTSYGYEPDYFKYLEVTDNSDGVVELKAYDDHIDYKIIGEYDVILEAKDSSGKISSVSIKLNIVDIIKPVIKVLKPVTVSIGNDIKLSDYFEAKDHYYGDLTSFIVLENLNINVLGQQQIYASVTDLSGNEARLLINVTVIDDIKPVIKFNTNDARIDINEDITYDKMKSFILDVTDNYSTISIDKIDIDFSAVLNQLGSYSVFYKVKDGVGNETTAELIVRVVQMQGPIITCQSIVIGKNELFQESSIVDYITIYDPYDIHAANTLKVDLSGVNLGKPGVYLAVVTAVNSSGIVSTETLKFTVEGNTFDILKYWPISLIIIGPIGYFAYIKIKERKNKKYE